MKTDFATKITPTIFSYHLTGLDMDIRYNSFSRTFRMIDSETEEILKTKECSEDIDFEEFRMIARTMFLEIVMFSN